MRVVNRDGDLVLIDFDAIKRRIVALCSEEEHAELDIDRIVVRTIAGIEDNITTSRLDELSAMISASHQSHHYLYETLAGKILVSNLHKNTRRIIGTEKTATFSEKIAYIHMCHNDVLNDDFVAFVSRYGHILDDFVDYSRDMRTSYFAFRTLEKAYLLRANDIVIESPQDMWMRVATAVHFPRDGDITKVGAILDDIKTMYDHMSKGYYTHATPTLFNAGTRHEQLSSCYLLGTDDSLSGIYKTLGDCAQISKWAGGLGVHVSNVRAKGSIINSTRGKSDGIVPMLKVFNETARYCNQCLAPDTVLYTRHGSKFIRDIVPGDSVLTSDGTFQPVLRTIVNDKHEDIFVIHSEYSVSPLRCTGVHDVYALKLNAVRCTDVKRTVDTGIVRPEFVPASDLVVGDYLAYPIPRVTEDVSGLTEDDCRFCGLVIGHSAAERDSRVNMVSLKPEDVIWMQSYLREKGVVARSFSDRDVHFVWTDLPIAKHDLFAEPRQKTLSPRFATISPAKITSLIKGFISDTGYWYEFRTVSLSLVEAVRYLLLRLGIVSSGIFEGGVYTVCIPKVSPLCENGAVSCDYGFFEWNGLLFHPIRSIDTERYDGQVFDLSVAANHNYTTNCGLVHNSGRRKGSIAIYLEPWHADVLEFIELRRQTGAESNRARDLFLALWVPDEFMRRVVAGEDWYLMTPDECPGLSEAFGSDFDALYNRYVEEGKYVKKIDARSLWTGVLQSQVETGTPYIMFKDTVNAKCNQNNVGTIKSSNLCVAPETQILTSIGYRMISELEDRDVAVWNGEKFSRVTVKKTGTGQRLLTVSFSNGESLDCTHYHKFYIQEGELTTGKQIIVEAQDLKPGMKIVKFPMPVIDDANLKEDFKYPYTHGLMTADGTYDKTATGEQRPRITLYGEKTKLLKHVDRTDLEADASADGKRLVVAIPTDIAPRYAVPFDQRLHIKLRWLEGLADGDGFLIRDQGGCCSLQIASVNYEFLIDVKHMLNTMGVDPKISKLHNPADKMLPDGRGGLAAYPCRASCQLVVSSWDLKKLIEQGFSPKRLVVEGVAVPHRDVRHSIRVISVTDNGRKDDTFCFNEPLAHAGVFNGIRTGNCAEVTQYSDSTCYAVCNLGSIAVNQFYDAKRGVYDHEGLHAAAQQLTYNLNRIIDVNFYPTPETRRSNLRMRPIGIGVQGFGDLYNMMGVSYESAEAIDADAKIMETIYHGAITASIELAKNDGPYEAFLGSMFSKGTFQFDLYDDVKLSGMWDWDQARKDVQKYGIRNSMLTALMPTASTSQILGNVECFEPIQSNVFKRTTLAGEFLVVNRHLMKDLIARGMWSTAMRDELLDNDGSVATLKMPADIVAVYKTVWEIGQRFIIDHAAARAPFVDQSQSMNLFFGVPNYQKMHSALVHAWKRGLKTGCYYMRSKPAAEALKVATPSSSSSMAPPPVLVCSRDDKTCVMCSA